MNGYVRIALLCARFLGDTIVDGGVDFFVAIVRGSSASRSGRPVSRRIPFLLLSRGSGCFPVLQGAGPGAGHDCGAGVRGAVVHV